MLDAAQKESRSEQTRGLHVAIVCTGTETKPHCRPPTVPISTPSPPRHHNKLASRILLHVTRNNHNMDRAY